MKTEKLYESAQAKSSPTTPYRPYLVYFLTTVSTLFLLFQTLPALIIDPYRVLGFSNFNQKNFSPNTRYLKVEHLVQSDTENAFLVGTSRTNYYTVESANQLSGYNYYNLNAEGDNSLGIRRKVEWLVETQPTQQIILALDYDLGYGEIDSLELVRQDHPRVTGEFPLFFYLKYFLFQPTTIYDCITGNLKDETIYLFDSETGHFWFRNYLQLRENPNRYKGNQFNQLHDWEKPKPIEKNIDSIAEYSQAIAAIDRHQIQRFVIINPINQVRFSEFDIDDYLHWYREMVIAAGEVWDFSGFNSITTNDRMYYDTSHFIPEVGDMVLSRVFESSRLGSEIPADFGVRVTAENLEARIEQLYQEYNRYHQGQTQTSP